MNNRLTIQDIAGLLAEKTGKSRNACERFLRAFVTVSSEGLLTDRLVKVKGIGTFKLIWVDPRESVNITTGERIMLPAHYKCTFLPDAELKERVNEPFSFFETVELSEDADIQQLESLPEEEKEVEAEIQPVAAEPVIETPPPPVATPRPPHIPPKHPVSSRKKDNHRKSNHRKGWIGGIGVFLVAVCGLCLYLYMGSHYVVKDTTPPVGYVVADDLAPQLPEDDSLLADEALLAADTVAATDSVTPYKEVKVITIKENDRLTYLAEAYYGNRAFWVYIYQFNKTVIRNPDVIAVGMELILPDPEVYGIDANDSASIRKALLLEKEMKVRKE